MVARNASHILASLLLALSTPAATFAQSGAQAGETRIRLVDGLALAPDGKTLAFAWMGDIWSAPIYGGTATRLTHHPGSDGQPIFSPNGRRIAFVSSREARSQVYLMSAEGGPATRLSRHTEGYALEEWYPDGRALLASARRDHFWRNPERFMRLATEGDEAPKVLFDGYGRDGALSPDGKHLLFTREGTRWFRKRYRGTQASQLWHYELKSGEFRQLTTHDTGERWPLWAPDGKHYYVVSQEDGAFNLWYRSLDARVNKKLTNFTDDGVHFPAISRDGTTIVFRNLFDVYRLDTRSQGEPVRVDLHDGGVLPIESEQRRVLSSATAVAFSADTREIALIAGGDVWVMDTELREPKRITDTPEEERDVLFSPDGERILFVSDAEGQADIWQAKRADEERYWWLNDEFVLKRLTRDAEVESGLRWSPDGETLAFLKVRGDLWIMGADGKDARRVLESWNEPDFDFSPDGKWIVYAVSDSDFNRDVWLLKLEEGAEPFNLSRHPDNESGPRWSPDGKKIAFTGRRWDTETDVYYVWLTRDDDEITSRERRMEKALKAMKGRKKVAPAKSAPAKKPTSAKAPEKKSAAPADDGLSGTWDGEARGEGIPGGSMKVTLELSLQKDGSVTGSATNPQGTAQITSGKYDRKSGALELVIEDPEGMRYEVKAKVSKGKMTGSAKMAGTNVEFRFTAERTAAPKAAVPKTATAAEGAAQAKSKKAALPEVAIDFDGIHERIQRITIMDSTESGLLWSPDGKKLAFRATVAGKGGIYTVEFEAGGSRPTPKFFLPSLGSNPRWLKEGGKIVTLQGGKPAVIAGGRTTTYAFRAKQRVEPSANNAALFDQAWRAMRDGFYDERLGNRNWDAIRRKYQPMASECLDMSQLGTVVSLMLGELNGSHLGFYPGGMSRFMRAGVSSGGATWRETTGHLGVRFDPAHKGPGLRIQDVIDDTPSAREKTGIAAGEIILSIDGTNVDPAMNLATVLTGDPERMVELKVRDAKGEDRTVVLRPTSYSAVRSALYEKWIDDNQAAVERLSKGRLGYMHISGMNWSSFQRFEAELYAVGYGKDGILIDVRENGGGSTADHLLTVLCQPEHAITRPRGSTNRGYPQDRRVYATWNKPVAVLCNQNSFSNAEIFSHAIKTLKRGQVIGVTTAGGVISTGGAMLMGQGMIRMPFRGWYLLDGEDMELNGCVPHHVVWPAPCEWPSGVDRQLEKACEALNADCEAWRARPQVKLRKSSER